MPIAIQAIKPKRYPSQISAIIGSKAMRTLLRYLSSVTGKTGIPTNGKISGAKSPLSDTTAAVTQKCFVLCGAGTPAITLKSAIH